MQETKEKKAWRLTKKLDRFDAYRYFLTYHPGDGKRQEKAKNAYASYQPSAQKEIEWAARQGKGLSTYLDEKYLFFFPLRAVENGSGPTIYFMPEEEMQLLATYLRQFPDGVFSGFAKLRFANLLLERHPDGSLENIFNQLRAYEFSASLSDQLAREVNAIRSSRKIGEDLNLRGAPVGAGNPDIIDVKKPVLPADPDENESKIATGLIIPEKPLNPKPPDNQKATQDQHHQQLLNVIRAGRFEYDPIPPLEVDKTFTFTLTIIPASDSSKPKSQAGKAGKVIKNIAVTDKMRVHMGCSDPNTVHIVPVSDTLQNILPGGTAWAWEITPCNAGEYTLTVYIKVLSKEGATMLEPIQEEIKVIVKEVPPPPPDPDVKVSGFSPYYLLPLLLVGVLLIFFFYQKKFAGQPALALAAKPSKAIAPSTYLIGLPKGDVLANLKVAEELIADGETGRAIDHLRTFFHEASETIHTDMINLSSEYSQYEREYNLGMNPDKATLNRINFALVNLIGKIKAGLEG